MFLIPFSLIALIKLSGMPQIPNPPNNIVWPSLIPAKASSTEFTILLIPPVEEN